MTDGVRAVSLKVRGFLLYSLLVKYFTAGVSLEMPPCLGLRFKLFRIMHQLGFEPICSRANASVP